MAVRMAGALRFVLSFLPFMLCVHMAGAVWTIVYDLCLSIFMFGLVVSLPIVCVVFPSLRVLGWIF